MKHTPGPWKIGNNGSVVCNNPDKQVEMPDQDGVRFYGGHVICETVTAANARLITASPDLLEVLKYLLILEDDCDAAGTEWHDAYRDAQKQARAAIAKAEE